MRPTRIRTESSEGAATGRAAGGYVIGARGRFSNQIPALESRASAAADPSNRLAIRRGSSDRNLLPRRGVCTRSSRWRNGNLASAVNLKAGNVLTLRDDNLHRMVCSPPFR